MTFHPTSDDPPTSRIEDSSRIEEPNPFVVFAPSLGRFILVELWSVTSGLVVAAVLFHTWGVLSTLWVWTTLAGSLVVMAYGAFFLKRSKTIVIGDTWMTGPTDGSFESMTILFDTLDTAATGVRKGQLTIRSISGREITTKTAWYTSEEIDEIKRVIRERVSHSGAGGILSW